MWYSPIHVLNLWGFQIQVWGLLLALGVVLAWFLLDYNLWWRNIKHDTSWLVLGFVVSAMIGSRLLQVVLDWNYYSQNISEIPQVWKGGLASFGAYGGGFLFLFLYLSKIGKKKNDFLDAVSGAMMVALLMARTGCFLINDHLGKLSSDVWPAIYVAGQWRQPISLYYMLIDFLLVIVNFYFFYTNKFKGKLFWLTIFLYGVLRALVDVVFKDFEGDVKRFNTTLVLCLVFITVGLFYLLKRMYNKAK